MSRHFPKRTTPRATWKLSGCLPSCVSSVRLYKVLSFLLHLSILPDVVKGIAAVAITAKPNKNYHLKFKRQTTDKRRSRESFENLSNRPELNRDRSLALAFVWSQKSKKTTGEKPNSNSIGNSCFPAQNQLPLVSMSNSNWTIRDFHVGGYDDDDEEEEEVEDDDNVVWREVFLQIRIVFARFLRILHFSPDNFYVVFHFFKRSLPNEVKSPK